MRNGEALAVQLLACGGPWSGATSRAVLGVRGGVAVVTSTEWGELRCSDFCDSQPARSCWAGHLIPFQVSHGGLCMGYGNILPRSSYHSAPFAPRRAASVMAHLPTHLLQQQTPIPRSSWSSTSSTFPPSITLTSPCLSSHLDSMPMLIPVVH